MTARKFIVSSFRHAYEFLLAICSALLWANILTGHSGARVALLFFGGLVLPFADRMYFQRVISVTPVGVFAGIGAIAMELFEGRLKSVVGGIFWLEGSSDITLNLMYFSWFSILLLVFGMGFGITRWRQQRNKLQLKDR